MGADQIRRWESGALAHAVSDPFGQGPLPWLRGSENYFDDTGQVVPWYADPDLGRGGAGGGTRTADDVRRQIKGFVSPGAAAPGEAIDFHITVDPPQQFSVDIYRIGHYGGDGAAKITTSPRLSGIVQPPPLTADRTVSCHHWWQSWRLQIPTYWSIGAYVAASAANPNPVQPESAIIAIKFTIGLLPAIAALLAMLIFIKYPLNDKRFQEIRDETEARKLAAITAHHARPEDFVIPDHKV